MIYKGFFEPKRKSFKRIKKEKQKRVPTVLPVDNFDHEMAETLMFIGLQHLVCVQDNVK